VIATSSFTQLPLKGCSRKGGLLDDASVTRCREVGRLLLAAPLGVVLRPGPHERGEAPDSLFVYNSIVRVPLLGHLEMPTHLQ
jgi:hypothetical protein